jgi:NAD(P)-dependent dehydrogenase (short-subunit alcohol dehydrogenase family)
LHVVEDMGVEGGNVHAWVLDVRDLSAVKQLADDTVARHGGVDLLINNAGVLAPPGYVWQQEEADWCLVHDVNFRGVMNGVSAFVPRMIDCGRWHVVNTASIAGLALVGQGNGIYAASKHAIVGLTEALQAELDVVAPAVRTTIFCPGPVRTGLKAAVDQRLTEGHRDRVDQHREQVPLGHELTRISAEAAAEACLVGIEDDVHYLVVGPGTRGAVRARAQLLLDVVQDD